MNTLSRIGEAFDKEFYLFDEVHNYNISFSNGNFTGNGKAVGIGNKIKSFYRHQILDLIKGIKAEMKKKNKHDDINGVWTEANHNKLVDCSYREAECYNSAIKDVTAILDNYKKEIQK